MRKISILRLAFLPLLAATFVSAACEGNTTVPSPIVEQSLKVHTGPLDPQSTNTYLFTLGTASTVQVMLAGALVDGPLRSVSTTLRVALSTWDVAASTCSTIEAVSIVPRMTAALHRQLDPGTYCATVSDPGGMTQSVGIVLRIAAPALVLTGASPGTELFASAITNGGTATRTFQVSMTGTVNVTLRSLTGSSVPVGLGVGVVDTDNGTCKISQTVTALAGPSPQLSLPMDAGVFCAALYDIGNFEPGQRSFAMTIEHP